MVVLRFCRAVVIGSAPTGFGTTLSMSPHCLAPGLFGVFFLGVTSTSNKGYFPIFAVDYSGHDGHGTFHQRDAAA